MGLFPHEVVAFQLSLAMAGIYSLNSTHAIIRLYFVLQLFDAIACSRIKCEVSIAEASIWRDCDTLTAVLTIVNRFATDVTNCDIMGYEATGGCPWPDAESIVFHKRGRHETNTPCKAPGRAASENFPVVDKVTSPRRMELVISSTTSEMNASA